MSFVIWILLGGLLGRATSALSGIRGWQAITRNVVIGIVGVLFAGWLLGGLIGTSVFAPGDYSLSSLLMALMATTVLLGAVQLLQIHFKPFRERFT